MPITLKALFAGILSDEETEVYICPAEKTAAAKIIRLVNVSDQAVTVNVSGDFGAGHIRQFPKDYSIAAHQVAGDPNFDLFLGPGHKIVIHAAAAGALHCYIGGIERSS